MQQAQEGKLVVLDDQAVRVRSGDGPAGRTPL